MRAKVRTIVREQLPDGRIHPPAVIHWPSIVRGTPRLLVLAQVCEVCPHIQALCCDRGAACRKIGKGDNEFRLVEAMQRGAANRGAGCPEGRWPQ